MRSLTLLASLLISSACFSASVGKVVGCVPLSTSAFNAAGARLTMRVVSSISSLLMLEPQPLQLPLFYLPVCVRLALRYTAAGISNRGALLAEARVVIGAICACALAG